MKIHIRGIKPEIKKKFFLPAADNFTKRLIKLKKLSFGDKKLDKFIHVQEKRQRFTPVFKKRREPSVSSAPRYYTPINSSFNLNKSDSQKSKKLCPYQLTPLESKEIQNMISSQIEKEYEKASNRLIRKINSTKKLGVLSEEGYDLREKSMICIESSAIEKKKPMLKKVATHEILLKRDEKGLKVETDSRKDLLKKIENVVTQNYSPINVYGGIKNSDNVKDYMEKVYKSMQKYAVRPFV